MKLINKFLSAAIVCCIIFFACKKTDTVYVPTETTLPGLVTKINDTVIVTSTNITYRYITTSPCYPSNEIFFFHITATSFATDASYKWEFGDGGSETGESVSHKYEYNSVYTVTLKVIVNNNIVQQVTNAVKPYGQYVSPVASFGSSLNNYQDPNYVAFNAQSSVNNGSIVAYHWDWKDGTQTTVATAYTEHRFPEIAKDSNYPVTLTVTSNAGCQTSDTNMVFVPASYNSVGNISFTKTNACKPDSQVFTFVQDSFGLPANTRYEWDLGEGIRYWGNPLKHHFIYSKTYPVICYIHIMKPNGTSQKTLVRNTSVYALGSDINPIAYINGVQALDSPINKTWQFSGWGKIGDGHIITKLVWDFDDGTQDTNNTPYAQHTFIPIMANQKYAVKLTVTASSGCTDSITLQPGIIVP